MSVSGFLRDKDKTGTVMSLIANGKDISVKNYIMSWTDCTEKEAEDVISILANSPDYDLYLKKISKVKEDLIKVRERQNVLWRTPVSFGAITPKTVQTTKKETRKKTEYKVNNSTHKKASKADDKGTTYLVDGDNHIEMIKGINNLRKKDDMRIYVSQEGLYDKLTEKVTNPRVDVIYVPSREKGDQAVDNRIKTDLGHLVTESDKKIQLISHDKGYDKNIKKYIDKTDRTSATLSRKKEYKTK